MFQVRYPVNRMTPIPQTRSLLSTEVGTLDIIASGRKVGLSARSSFDVNRRSRDERKSRLDIQDVLSTPPLVHLILALKPDSYTVYIAACSPPPPHPPPKPPAWYNGTRGRWFASRPGARSFNCRPEVTAVVDESANLRRSYRH